MKKNEPLQIHLKAGTYAWCRCGETRNGPWCDGSHKKENELAPLVFYQPTSEDVKICHCNATQTPPFCDGSHQRMASQ